MRPTGISANALARRIDVPVTRISEIVRGGRGITADTALRLARYFGTSAELWLGLQVEYDLRMAERELAGSLEEKIVPMGQQATGRHAPAPSARSQIREAPAAYGTLRAARRDRDRRRIRRTTDR